MRFEDYMKDEYNLAIDGDMEAAKSGIKYCIQKGIRIFGIGNGGSAYNVAHFVQDLNKVLGANATSLSDNYGLVMAIANDISYSEVFRYQLSNVKEPHILIAVSGSGNSDNILQAVSNARSMKVPVLSFTGFDGGELAKISNLNINVASNNMYAIESIHSLLFHFIIDSLSRELYQ